MSIVLVDRLTAPTVVVAWRDRSLQVVANPDEPIGDADDLAEVMTDADLVQAANMAFVAGVVDRVRQTAMRLAADMGARDRRHKQPLLTPQANDPVVDA